MKKISLMMFLGILIVFFASYVQADNKAQIIMPDSAEKSVSVGQEFGVNISYDVSDKNSSLTGLGLRIHYDSSALEFMGLSNVLSLNKIGESASPQDDSKNADNDGNTDKVLLISWVDISGSWPGSLPSDLVTVNFKAKKASETLINFTADTAAGYSLQAQSVKVKAY